MLWFFLVPDGRTKKVYGLRERTGPTPILEMQWICACTDFTNGYSSIAISVLVCVVIRANRTEWNYNYDADRAHCLIFTCGLWLCVYLALFARYLYVCCAGGALLWDARGLVSYNAFVSYARIKNSGNCTAAILRFYYNVLDFHLLDLLLIE